MPIPTLPPLPKMVMAVAPLVCNFILPVVPLACAFKITPSSAAPTVSVEIARPLAPDPPVPAKIACVVSDAPLTLSVVASKVNQIHHLKY